MSEVKIEKYPNWVKDNVDKIIHNVYMEHHLKTGDAITRNVLKNKVNQKILEIFYKDMDFDDKIMHLYKDGIISHKKKTTEITLLEFKND